MTGVAFFLVRLLGVVVVGSLVGVVVVEGLRLLPLECCVVGPWLLWWLLDTSSMTAGLD